MSQLSSDYWVYILANKVRNLLYIGVTNDLKRRTWEHENELLDGYTARYRIHDLVYYERFDSIKTAIAREKQLKGWSQAKKTALIEQFNPRWICLNEQILGSEAEF